MSISNACSDEHRPLAAYGLLTATFGALALGQSAAPRTTHTEAMPS